jgi:heavy metal sensor kinase
MGLSVRIRLTAWYAGVLAIILLVLGGTLYAAFAHALWAHARDTLRIRATQLASFVEGSDVAHEEATFFDLADPSVVERFSTGGVLIQIRNTGGRVVNESSTLAGRALTPPEVVRRALGGAAAWDWSAVEGVGPVLVYTEPIAHRGAAIGVAQVATPVAPISESLERLRWLLIVGGIAAVAVAVGGGYLLASLALGPIDRITAAAREIGATTLGRRLRLGGPNDEVRRLALAFDEMLDRIDETLDRERRFTADAAHELRTPLTILKGELEVALRRERSPQAYRQAMASMAQEVDRLVRLTDDLLTLARADAGGVPLEREAVAVDTLIGWAAEHFQRAAQEKGVTVETSCPDPLAVWGDPDRLRQLLTNLLDNAITYTPTGGRVGLSCVRDGSFARVTVVDSGAGIAPEDLPRVFDRFYRADRARVRTSGGSGLGLPIAQWIVRAHGGRIRVESHPGLGTTVTVWLPLSETSSFSARSSEANG